MEKKLKELCVFYNATPEEMMVMLVEAAYENKLLLKEQGKIKGQYQKALKLIRKKVMKLVKETSQEDANLFEIGQKIEYLNKEISMLKNLNRLDGDVNDITFDSRLDKQIAIKEDGNEIARERLIVSVDTLTKQLIVNKGD